MPNLFNRTNLIKSFKTNENRKANPITINVSLKGIAVKPKNPKVEKETAKHISANIIINRVLLGAVVQKCFFSRTTNIEKMAKKKRISKLKVLSAPLSNARLK